ncbi:hypothetical protein BX616_000288 [Lobosporangium transversale]|uniref:E2 ubiquitin-conjugating enzyme n=1 Tax=Lobosporangium transversale TaxID=64571 RepID=A0A1Y2GN01_9FUNG|nr:ubiquitin-conjugating enzyme/RWD-like protein [Lobosporangium transversale]KAF9907922.1 hypothetical protein BX616_000288 [Lobosporangium transversale]ORZ16068.1 ubiquitin-conjugating enzyme/RWD-like protein [Lobosporangium transversale]|eukprot:XP_021881415.1 ubiquitin-conjugating enzyme/RWD-like protein [Lobosporangium transversale]
MDSISPAAQRKVTRELYALEQDPPEGIRLILNEDSITDIQAWIQGPGGTPYEGGVFRIRIQLSADFPNSPPKCFFVTKIFHPNVSKQGDICVSTLKKDWKKDLGLRHILLVIKCLLIVPNPESALNEEAGRQLLERYDDYAKHARLMTSIHARGRNDIFKPLSASTSTASISSPSPSSTSTLSSASSTKSVSGESNNTTSNMSTTIITSNSISNDSNTDLGMSHDHHSNNENLPQYERTVGATVKTKQEEQWKCLSQESHDMNTSSDQTRATKSQTQAQSSQPVQGSGCNGTPSIPIKRKLPQEDWLFDPIAPQKHQQMLVSHSNPSLSPGIIPNPNSSLSARQTLQGLSASHNQSSSSWASPMLRHMPGSIKPDTMRERALGGITSVRTLHGVTSLVDPKGAIDSRKRSLRRL